MANNTPKTTFDPKAFLAVVGDGKTILEFETDQVVFKEKRQIRSFTFKKAGSRLSSYPNKAKRR
jgi:hypothetical protein